METGVDMGPDPRTFAADTLTLIGILPQFDKSKICMQTPARQEDASIVSVPQTLSEETLVYVIV